MTGRIATSAAVAAVFSVSMTFGAAHAADQIKIGMITTLSGPGAGLGIDVRDGFLLGVEHEGGTLGGLPVEIVEADDQQKPEVAVQLTERMVEREEVDLVTGVIWSNLALAMMPTLAQSETLFISPNAGPSQLAGEGCNPFFFNVAWQNDNDHEAMGKYVQDEGYTSAYLIAPNYPAGKDALTGFKRFYQGEVVGEVYTQLGQLDYSAEVAQLRAANPSAVYFFLPGGMGINFMKQYAQAGLKDEIPVFGPAFSFDQDILGAVGDDAIGVLNTSQWSPDLDNEANVRFVADFQAKFGRIPSAYASQGYDAARLISSAVAKVGGNLEDKSALIEALQAAEFASVRGPFRFNVNHYPIQNYYLREVYKNDQGVLTNRIVRTVFEDHADAYAGACKM